MKTRNILNCTLVVLLLCCLFMLSACSDDTKTPDNSVEPAGTPTSEVVPTPGVEPTPNNEYVTCLGETDDMGQEYIDKITFLGDSTTYGLKFYGMLSDGKETEQVWTPSSGTLTLSNQSWATIVFPSTGEEITIRDAVEKTKPEMMVITLGVNGVSFLTQDGFKSEYTALVSDIKALSPDTKIILNSIYPVQSDYQYIADINNDKISAANGWIETIAEDCDVKYLDTYSQLVGTDGYLNKDYGNGDGIHLGPDGFERVLNYIRTHGYN